MPDHPGAPETFLLGAALLALAAVLAAVQLVERRRRVGPAGGEASAHPAGRDRRRFQVAGVLGLIGLGMLATTRIDVRAGRAEARLWAWTWIGVLALAVLLLVLAALDWRAQRAHARRQARALVEEQRALLADLLRSRPDPGGPA